MYACVRWTAMGVDPANMHYPNVKLTNHNCNSEMQCSQYMHGIHYCNTLFTMFNCTIDITDKAN